MQAKTGMASSFCVRFGGVPQLHLILVSHHNVKAPTTQQKTGFAQTTETHNRGLIHFEEYTHLSRAEKKTANIILRGVRMWPCLMQHII